MAEDPSVVLEGQAEVVDAVLAASRIFVAVASNAIADTTPEVTLPQFRTLVLLDIHRTMTVAHLAEALGVAPSTASRMCNRLVAKKLVRRATDRANRRQVKLALLPAGRELIAASVPEVLGTGCGWVQQSLDRPELLTIPLWAVLLLPFAKIVATSLSIGTGGSGGIFGPGMVIGAFTGAAVWRLLEPIAPGVPAGPAPFVIVGMMACFGSIARAPLAMMLMVAEMTGSLTILVARDGGRRARLPRRPARRPDDLPRPVAQPGRGAVVAAAARLAAAGPHPGGRGDVPAAPRPGLRDATG